MKAVDVMKDAKRKNIIEQLHEHEYYDTENKSYVELKHKLAVIKAMEGDSN